VWGVLPARRSSGRPFGASVLAGEGDPAAGWHSESAASELGGEFGSESLLSRGDRFLAEEVFGGRFGPSHVVGLGFGQSSDLERRLVFLQDCEYVSHA
jgi:hypothetical protein